MSGHCAGGFAGGWTHLVSRRRDGGKSTCFVAAAPVAERLGSAVRRLAALVRPVASIIAAAGEHRLVAAMVACGTG